MATSKQTTISKRGKSSGQQFGLVIQVERLSANDEVVYKNWQVNQLIYATVMYHPMYIDSVPHLSSGSSQLLINYTDTCEDINVPCEDRQLKS